MTASEVSRADSQVLHRGIKQPMPYPGSARGEVDLIGNPIQVSDNPVDYRVPPPKMGEQTDEVLAELLGMDGEEISDLRETGVI